MPYRPPAIRPTMADVAREANVSVTTVSYVIGGRRGSNADGRISDDTRQRVLAAVDAIGYRVNLPARNLRRQRTDHVLLLIDRLASPFSQHAAADIESVLQQHGLSMSIVVCPSPDRLKAALEMVPGRLADGAIVLVGASRPDSRDLLERAAGQGVPLVAVSTHPSAMLDVVQPQNEGPAIAQAVDHLVGSGHQRIGFIGHVRDQDPPEPRLAAMRQQLGDHGLELDAGLVLPGARDRAEAYHTATSLLARPDRPTAILSASDIGGIATIWAAHRLGLHVPDDLAVVGCGNIDECLFSVPALSSAGPEKVDYTLVAELMVQRLGDPHRPAQSRTFEEWTFFPRESSQPTNATRDHQGKEAATPST
jgi:DNA-binding LacI/PurR family transcriptional regulator